MGHEINLLAHDQPVKSGRKVIKILECLSGHWDECHLEQHGHSGDVGDASVAVQSGKSMALTTLETNEALG